MNHFNQVYQELQGTDNLMEGIGYKSANTIVKQIVDRLWEEEENLIPQ